MTPEEITQRLTETYTIQEVAWSQWLAEMSVRLNLVDVPLLYQYTNITGLEGTITKQGNQLSQWRGYGDRGYGYSIGFDFQGLTQQLHGVTSSAWVIYDVAELVETCRKMSVDIVRALVQSLPADDADNAASEITEMVMKDISSGLPFFKHEGFKEEEEYRLYSSVAKMTARQFPLPFPVDIRPGQDMLIPYVKLITRLQGPRQPLPIRKIVVGPKGDFDKAKQAIQLLLNPSIGLKSRQ